MLGDFPELFNYTYRDTLLINPGCFTLNGFKFTVYDTKQKLAQESQVP
jgi:hypothetical protein